MRLSSDRPVVVVVADQPGWAFDRIARQLRRNLAREVNVRVIYRQQLGSLIRLLHQQGRARVIPRVDGVHFMWRRDLFDLVLAEGFKWAECQSGGPIHLSYSVYDHLSDSSYTSVRRRLNSRGATVGYVNQQLMDADHLVSHYQKFRTPDGVDTTMFTPIARRRQSPKDHLIIGWSGNASWGEGDHKGLHTIIHPAIALAQSRGCGLSFDCIDSSQAWLPHAAVSRRIRLWDLAMVASKSEGTPNVALEALASGVPVLGTRVGMMPELQEAGAPIFSVDRSPEAFASQLVHLSNASGTEWDNLRGGARLVARRYDWRVVLTEFLDLWGIRA